jgi:hypothetical protein
MIDEVDAAEAHIGRMPAQIIQAGRFVAPSRHGLLNAT